MSRPHEDRERLLQVDHRPGGEPITFAAGARLAVESAQVKRSRIDAALSAYETMIEHLGGSPAEPRAAAVFAAATRRNVLVLCEVGGYRHYAQLASAWDNHHRVAERHAVTESRDLGLFHVPKSLGDIAIDPASVDAYIVERFSRARDAVSPTIGETSALGFRGAALLLSDDGNRSIIIHRFERLDQFSALRAASAPHAEHLHPVKTFGGIYASA